MSEPMEPEDTRPAELVKPRGSRAARGTRKCVAVLVVLTVPCLAAISFFRSGAAASHFPWGGAVPLALAVFIFAVNLYALIGRPLLYMLRRGGKGYTPASPFPIVASLFAAIAIVTGWGVPWIAVTGSAVYMLDVGGPLVFLLSVWRDATFWDADAL